MKGIWHLCQIGEGGTCFSRCAMLLWNSSIKRLWAIPHESMVYQPCNQLLAGSEQVLELGAAQKRHMLTQLEGWLNTISFCKRLETLRRICMLQKHMKRYLKQLSCSSSCPCAQNSVLLEQASYTSFTSEGWELYVSFEPPHNFHLRVCKLLKTCSASYSWPVSMLTSPEGQYASANPFSLKYGWFPSRRCFTWVT